MSKKKDVRSYGGLARIEPTIDVSLTVEVTGRGRGPVVAELAHVLSELVSAVDEVWPAVVAHHLTARPRGVRPPVRGAPRMRIVGRSLRSRVGGTRARATAVEFGSRGGGLLVKVVVRSVGECEDALAEAARCRGTLLPEYEAVLPFQLVVRALYRYSLPATTPAEVDEALEPAESGPPSRWAGRVGEAALELTAHPPR